MLARSPYILEDPHDTRWRRLRTKAPSLIAVGALHAAAIVALLQYAPVREALSSAAPIMVSLITPKLEVEKPQVEPPKPKLEPVKKKPIALRRRSRRGRAPGGSPRTHPLRRPRVPHAAAICSGSTRSPRDGRRRPRVRRRMTPADNYEADAPAAFRARSVRPDEAALENHDVVRTRASGRTSTPPSPARRTRRSTSTRSPPRRSALPACPSRWR
jgi:hypothetical protein